jgi:radical SAM superfamily enzyme YgiQ (UPF0313 family)
MRPLRILLIRPPVPKHTMGLKHVMICEPLELEYVAASAPGHEFQIFDMILEKGLERRLKSFRPDIVGTSCYITGVNEVIKLCRTVKDWNPGCLTVVGGVHASLAAEDFLDPSVDCIVLGDGTTTFPLIVEARMQGAALSTVPGLALPDGDRLTRTAPARYMKPPDQLPLPRRDLTGHLRHRYYYLFHRPVALMKTTWGCWYKCNFCFTWKITGGSIYVRSPESIVDELETIAEEDVYIVDDIFLIRPSRLARIAGLIRERGIHKKFLVYARADFVADNPDIIAEWSELGLSAVFIGLEASTDPELDSMNKQTSVDVNRAAVEVLRRSRIDTYGSLITQPDYGPEDWEKLWQFIEETGLYYVNISPLTPMPGTDIWDNFKDRLTVSRKAHGLFDLSHVLLPTRVPLREYYAALLRLYARTCLNLRRANKHALRTRPPVFSLRYMRLFLGAARIFLQMRRAHLHHSETELAVAMDRGPAPASGRRQRVMRGNEQAPEVAQ